VLMAQWSWAEKILYPYAVILQTIPILALVPLIGIWMGYSFAARVAVCVLIAVFPMISNTFFGLQSATQAAHDLMTLNRATRRQRLFKLEFPAAVPAIFTGLRTAAGLAVIGAIVGEFVGGGGLGVQVLTAMREQRTDIVFAAVLYAAGLGLALFGLVSLVGHMALRRWHASEL
jgi:NitT/TauT family transport system permease protein